MLNSEIIWGPKEVGGSTLEFQTVCKIIENVLKGAVLVDIVDKKVYTEEANSLFKCN